MSDMAKCEGRDCPIKHKCYRYTIARGPAWQYWIDEEYEGGECEHLYEIDKDPPISSSESLGFSQKSPQDKTRHT